MSTLPDGRNIIPIANSDSKCLLENWVEERAVSHIDQDVLKLRKDTTSMAQVLKHGHRGLLTTNFGAPTKDLTTHLDAYRPLTGPGIRVRGSRTEMMEKMLLEKVLNEIDQEQNPPEEPVEFKSITHAHYNQDDFSPMQPAPTSAHDYRVEQSVTFWSEHRDKIHGVSQTKPTFDSAFKKNAAFSRPIHESWEPEKSKPYEPDHYPNM